MLPSVLSNLSELHSLRKISKTRRRKMFYAWPQSELAKFMRSSKMNGSNVLTSQALKNL